jgi:anti-sigma B factor antagonist
MTFHVGTEEVAEGTFVVAVDGELDLYTAPDLEAALLGALAAGGRRIAVDLALTTFIDSVALGTLVRAAKELRQEDGMLVVVCGPDVGHFFEVAGLDRFFDLEPTREAALARLEAHGR